MPNLSTEFVVAAPAEAVWDVVGRRFDRIGEWATAIAASRAVPARNDSVATTRPGGLAVVPAVLDAPVTGRICRTGMRLLPHVTELLVAYDDTIRTLTYRASGLPAFVTTAENTWTVTPIDQRRTRVSLHARFDARGMLGLLGRWVILAQVGRTSRHLAEDLRHFVEHGTPSPRKQRQLNRRGWPAGQPRPPPRRGTR
jgi:hypothetical protein